MRDYLKAVLDKNLGNGLQKYIEEELFTQIHILHPLYAVHGKIEQDSMKQLKRDGTKIIVTPDRNIISLLNTAVKKGTFDGANKKKIKGFLMWTIRI